MAGVSRFGFLAIAVAFHLVYILSIFDIYFVSPIVSGMRLFGVERKGSAQPPADRLVLFVGEYDSKVPWPQLANALPQATVFAPTRRSSPSRNPIPRPTRTSSLDRLHPTYDRAYSSMELLVSLTPASPPSLALATSRSSRGYTRMCPPSRLGGSTTR